MITDAYNSLRNNRAVRADYLETLIESYFHGMNKDARNKAHDEFVVILNMEIKRNNNLTAAEVNSNENYASTIVSSCSSILTYYKGKRPLTDELFALLFNRVNNRISGTSNYIIDYLSNGDIVRLTQVISEEQLKNYKIFIVRNHPEKVDETIELLYEAFKDKYDYDRNSFYADLPEEYELGIFV